MEYIKSIRPYMRLSYEPILKIIICHGSYAPVCKITQTIVKLIDLLVQILPPKTGLIGQTRLALVGLLK